MSKTRRHEYADIIFNAMRNKAYFSSRAAVAQIFDFYEKNRPGMLKNMPLTSEIAIVLRSDQRFIYDREKSQWICRRENEDFISSAECVICKGSPNIYILSKNMWYCDQHFWEKAGVAFFSTD